MKVKSPIEMTMSVLKLLGTHRFADPGVGQYLSAASGMGQGLMNPPTVEGWHTGTEWIDGGTLNHRVNFAVDQLDDATQPGIQAIVDTLSASGGLHSPDEFVNQCLDLAGPLSVGPETQDGLLAFARSGGDLNFGTGEERSESESRIVRMLQLIVSTREYQFG